MESMVILVVRWYRGLGPLGFPEPADLEVIFRENVRVTEEFAREFFQGLGGVRLIAGDNFDRVLINSLNPAEEDIPGLFNRVNIFLREQKGEVNFQVFQERIEVFGWR